MIADYGHGDLAFAEVIQRIKYYLPDAEPVLTPVPPFSTLAAGFCIAQLALNQAPSGTLIYHNVAPREDEQDPRRDNTGERLAFARLATGVRVIGVNAGYAFAFLRDVAQDLRWAAAPAGGSQFRSRDIFPQAAATIALGQPDGLAQRIPRRAIPQVPSNRVAYVDGYGNLKTTIKPGRVEGMAGARIRLKIGTVEREVIASEASFAVEPGQLAFAPGSSGWHDARGSEARWLEVFLRAGNAWEAFGRPPVGTQIRLILD